MILGNNQILARVCNSLTLLPLFLAIQGGAACKGRQPTGSEASPNTVPASLVRIEVFSFRRLLVFQVCSPEHCWHQLFVQELKDDWPSKVICTKPVSELNGMSDALVESASWLPKPAHTLRLSLASSHGAFEPVTTTITLDRGCRYRLVEVRLQATGD